MARWRLENPEAVEVRRQKLSAHMKAVRAKKRRQTEAARRLNIQRGIERRRAKREA